MNVTFCDACGIECDLGSSQFTPLVHIVEGNGYVDTDWNPWSDKQERFDLCHKCYNVVFMSAMKAFKEIGSNSEEEQK